MEDLIVSAAEFQRRTILFKDVKSDSEAFVDTRLPGSTPKYNYTMIGSGVSANPHTPINLREPHGFNIGGASMPNGITNNLHVHFTAEVFITFAGNWRFRWGPQGDQGEYVSEAGDILTVPTWIFRGFTNAGPDDGFIFTTLGQDVTGGVIWSPDVMRAARGTGLAMDLNSKLVDLNVTPLPDDQLLPLMQPETIQSLRPYSLEEMRRRVVKQSDLVWSNFSFLDCALPGGKKQLAPVIGYGLTEDRNCEPPVTNPHGFKHEWLRAEPNNGLHTHRHADTQVFIVQHGVWEISVNQGSARMSTRLGPRDVFSVPAGAWRSLTCVEAGQASAGSPAGQGQLLMVTGGDNRTRIEWAPEVVDAAARSGWRCDANGYAAPSAVVALAAC